MDNAIIPECYVDTNLIETLVPPAKRNNWRGYNHQKGCGGVARTMKNEFSDRFALGIIDKDKLQVDYLNEFTQDINYGSLILHKHATRHHYIIQISPAIERFIFDNAASVGINVGDFDLPSDFQEFKKETKTENSKNNQRFKNLFKTLYQNGATDFVRLTAWVKYLKEENYKADWQILNSL